MRGISLPLGWSPDDSGADGQHDARRLLLVERRIDLGHEAAGRVERRGGLLDRLADEVGGHRRQRVAERHVDDERVALLQRLAGLGIGAQHLARLAAVLAIGLAVDLPAVAVDGLARRPPRCCRRGPAPRSGGRGPRSPPTRPRSPSRLASSTVTTTTGQRRRRGGTSSAASSSSSRNIGAHRWPRPGRRRRWPRPGPGSRDGAWADPPSIVASASGGGGRGRRRWPRCAGPAARGGAGPPRRP